MCSYNAAYGKPTCASDEMNNQMVRSDWDWDGFFVSDCEMHKIVCVDDCSSTLTIEK
jgi:beta-glucosidase-like glycosyl hydrolase